MEVPRPIFGIFTNGDDTPTTDAAITPDALQALGDLKDLRQSSILYGII